MMHYEEPLFRPPAEADSLIFQVARGCPHNTCRFCAMYKGVRYRVRAADEVAKEFAEAGECHPETRRVFLADGDVMALPFARLRDMLETLNRHFPLLGRVTLYANGRSIAAKSDAELAELRQLKLNTLYVGLETGDEELLMSVDKRDTAAVMTESVRRAQAAGLKCSVMVLLGLGGKAGSVRHAEQTAAVLNRMQPRLLSALRFVQVPGASMFPGYQVMSEYDVVLELIGLLKELELEKTVFRANHTSNPVPLEGRFPKDRDRLVSELRELIPELDQTGPGPPPWML